MSRIDLQIVCLLAACAGSCARTPESAAKAPSLLVEEPAVEPGLRWSPELVERYLAYQQAAAQAFGRAAPELVGERRGQKKDDDRLLVALKAQANLLEQARQRSGLGEPDLAELDQVVDAFLDQRERLSFLVPAKDLARVRPKVTRLPESLRRDMDRSIRELEDERREAEELLSFRAQYGNAVADLLLSKESELRRSREALVDALVSTPSHLPSP